MSYYEAYCLRWREYVECVTRCQAIGVFHKHPSPESLLMPCGPALVILLVSWYGEGKF